MNIIQEFELENLSKDQLQNLLIQQIVRSQMLVARNDVALFRYDVAEDNMYLLMMDARGKAQRTVYSHYFDNCPAIVYGEKEHKRIVKYLKRIIDDPNYPKTGSVEFQMLDGRQMVCEYASAMDEEGRVIAVVGQHVDVFMTRERVQQTITTLNEQNHTLGAFKYCYETIVLVNLTDNTFKLIRATKAVHQAAAKVNDVQQLAELFGKHHVDTEHYARYMEFLDPQTLSERLAGQKFISLNYLTKNIGWCHARIIPTDIDSQGNVIEALFTTEIADSDLQQLTYLRVAAERDGLTGLLNRMTGVQIINERMQQEPKRAIMAIFDCDKFKEINDKLGHPTGDFVLVEVAKALSETFPHEVVMRLGGDEFVLYIDSEKLTSCFNNESDSNAFFATLSMRVSQITIPESFITVTISGGAVVFDTDADTTFEQIYPKVDHLLYKAKQSHNGGIAAAVL